MKVRLLEIIPRTTLISVPPLVGNGKNSGYDSWELPLHKVAMITLTAWGILRFTSPICQSVNVLNFFDRTSRGHRSHGSRKYNNKSEIKDVSFDGPLPFVNSHLGHHDIRIKLNYLPLKRLHSLSTLTLHFTDVKSLGHRLHAIIFAISLKRLFKLPGLVDRYTENLSHIPGTRTLAFSPMHVKSTPYGGQRKNTSKLILVE